MAEVCGIGGNPSSVHQLGRAARRTLQTAQGHLQKLVGADAKQTDVIFCGSLAEAFSLAIVGLAHARRDSAKRRSVLLDASLWSRCPGLIQQLCLTGFVLGRIDFVAADKPFVIRRYALGPNPWDHGLCPIEPDDVAVLAVSALGAQGQTPPLALLAAWTQRFAVPFVIDASVAAGRMALQVDAHNVAATCLASAPLGGPPGIAALVWQKGVAAQPLWQGGGQNLGRRSGTEATVLAAGMGEAARQAHQMQHEEARRLGALRAVLCAGTTSLVLPPHCPHLVLWPMLARFVTGCVGLFDREGVMVGWAPCLPGETQARVCLTLGWDTTAEAVHSARTVLHKVLAQHKEDVCVL
jgi:cysteine desulfurase